MKADFEISTRKANSAYDLAISMKTPLMADGFSSEGNWWSGFTSPDHTKYIYIHLKQDLRHWEIIERQDPILNTSTEILCDKEFPGCPECENL